MMWVYLPASTFSPTTNANSAVLYWGTTPGWFAPQSSRAMTIHVPYYGGSPTNTVNWYTGGALNNTFNSNSDRVYTPYNAAQQVWELWCFTKDNSTGIAKIYRNGELAAGTKFTAMANKFQYFDLNTPKNNPSGDNGGLVIGSLPGQSGFWGLIDEIAIFDADLSPPDVDTTTGATIPGVPAVRFIDMFNMGNNG